MQTQMLTDPNQRATTVKNQGITETSVACGKNSENKLKILKILLETKTVTLKTLTQTTMSTIRTKTTTKTVTGLKGSQKLIIHTVRQVSKRTTPNRRCYVRASAAKRPLPWKSKPERQSGYHQQDAQDSITGCVLATAQHSN